MTPWVHPSSVLLSLHFVPEAVRKKKEMTAVTQILAPAFLKCPPDSCVSLHTLRLQDSEGPSLFIFAVLLLQANREALSPVSGAPRSPPCPMVENVHVFSWSGVFCFLFF